MTPGDSRKTTIPPVRTTVKAGFVVRSHNDSERKIVILEKGGLRAVDSSVTPRKELFKMRPGDLVGVATLLEREPIHYDLEATEMSDITIVSEDCMESELKNMPLWLLACIRELSGQNRQRRESLRKPRTENSLKSLAEFSRFMKKGKPYPMESLLQEFCWQTRVPVAAAKEDLKALCRRKFLELQKQGDTVCVIAPDPELLKLFVDYLDTLDQGKTWEPLRLTLNQKKALVMLSIIEASEVKDAPSWLAMFQQKGIDLTVADWIYMLGQGFFMEKDESHFSPVPEKVQYFLLALRYEINLRGVL